MNIQFRDVVKRYTGPNEALGRDGAGTVTGIPVDGGNGGGVQAIVAGAGIDVDDTDPANPVVTATGGGGGNTSTFVHDGSDYVASAGRIFIGPEDPDDTVTPAAGDIWMDPS